MKYFQSFFFTYILRSFLFILRHRDNVLSNVQWQDCDHVIAMWSNRVQNKTEIVWYNMYGEIVKTLDVVEHEGWVEIKNLFFYKDSVYIRKLQPSGMFA